MLLELGKRDKRCWLSGFLGCCVNWLCYDRLRIFFGLGGLGEAFIVGVFVLK
jgi:hypothetical protein